MSFTLSSLPESFHAERAELLELLRRDGILYRSPTQPVLSRDGTSARWMLDSLSVTLTPRGAELAGRCMLELLKRFDGRQIATYGLTAVPILQSCILQSGGSYKGLLVRKERKKHGSLKLIEGIIDPSEPIILIDDSISSGTSMTEACERLEEAGLRVEGCVALVRFGWYGGYALMQERGYHAEAVYDIWDDFISSMEDEEQTLSNPSKWFPEFQWSSERAPEGLHPAHLARIVMTEYLSTGQLLRAPDRLDKAYDSSGGVWISVRSRQDIHLRHARDGFWHFPGETRGTVPEDMVMASLRTAVHLPAGEEGLKAIAESGIAVTFFPAMEKCDVGQLDNDRYGIVVRSGERRSWMGGALPRMPGISNEWEQFQHARRKNGQLVSFEPYEIFRHDVVKAIEPEADWQPTGVPTGEDTLWHKNKNVCGPVVERARDVVLACLCRREEKSSPLKNDAVPEELDSVYLTVYINGHLRGCMGTVVRDIDADIQKLTHAALDDERFADNQQASVEPSRVAVSISFLFAPMVLGYFSPEEVVLRVRQGEQTLMAYRGERVGLLLPFVASTDNLDRVNFARAVIQKAGIEESEFNWCRFDCATWLADAVGVRRLVGGFPLYEPESGKLEDLLGHYAALHIQYLLRHQKDDGTLYMRYEPFQNRLHEAADAPRTAHAAWVLARARNAFGEEELTAASDKIINFLLTTVVSDEKGCWLETKEDESSIAEVSFMLLALLELPHDDSRRKIIPDLAATLWSSIDLHGRISTHRPPVASPEAFQDYSPGQALLALGAAAAAEQTEVNEDSLRRAFRYYRHRFRYRRHFGQVSWQMQAFARWWQVTKDAQMAAFVFEIGDWILGYQQEKTGGFINDHQPDAPGYTTALYLEGIGAAHKLALATGDAERQRRYLEAIAHGFRFLDRLIIQPRDASLLPNPALAIGGLRQSIHRSEIRIDFVQHSLAAIMEGMKGKG
jgi:AMMECR1 domain-containing protein/orotate phosphoribosyltransferase